MYALTCSGSVLIKEYFRFLKHRNDNYRKAGVLDVLNTSGLRDITFSKLLHGYCQIVL